MRIVLTVIAALTLVSVPRLASGQASQEEKSWKEVSRKYPAFAVAYRYQQASWIAALADAELAKKVTDAGGTRTVCQLVAASRVYLVFTGIRSTCTTRQLPPLRSFRDCWNNLMKCDNTTVGGVSGDCDGDFANCLSGRRT